MAEENSVELDTDEVQEETLSVAEQKLEEKPEKIDVDLGYTDPVKKETKAKVIEETDEKKNSVFRTCFEWQDVGPIGRAENPEKNLSVNGCATSC